MNNKISNKYTPFIIPAILLVAIVGLVVFVLKPGVDKLRSDSDRIQEKLIELDIEKEKIDELPKLKNQFLKVNSHEKELDVLFSQDNIIGLVQELEKAAEETSNIISISVEEGTDTIVKANVGKNEKAGDDEKKELLLADFSEEEYFLVDVDVKGTYSELLNFIARINKLNYYNSIINFEIVPSEDDEYKKNNISGGVISTNDAVAEANNSDIPDESNNAELDSKIKVVFYLNKQK